MQFLTTVGEQVCVCVLFSVHDYQLLLYCLAMSRVMCAEALRMVPAWHLHYCGTPGAIVKVGGHQPQQSNHS